MSVPSGWLRAVSTAAGPDIFFSWAGRGLGGEFVKSGLAAPMDKYYEQYKWDDRFLPVALSFSKQYARRTSAPRFLRVPRLGRFQSLSASRRR